MPGSIPGARKSFFWTCWECVFIDFYTCLDRFGHTFWLGLGHFSVGFGTRFGRVWDTFWSGLGQFLVGFGTLFGQVWDTFRLGLGHFVAYISVYSFYISPYIFLNLTSYYISL